MPERLRPLAAVLTIRNYRIYAAGNIISLIGMWMQRLAAGWLAWQLTESTAWLGLIAFADLFPTVVITPLAGPIADRVNRLTVVKITQSLAALQALTVFILVATGTINIVLLFLATLFLGILMAFNQPARLAVVPALVDRTNVNAAVALNSITFNLARFIGPSIAAVLIATFGIAFAFAANAVTYALFVVLLMQIVMAAPSHIAQTKIGLTSQYADGIKYILNHKGIGAVLLLLAATALGGRPIVELLPGFAALVFESDATGLAIMSSSIGVGSIVAGLTFPIGTGPQQLLRTLIRGTLVLGAAAILFSTIDLLGLGLVTLVIAGYGLSSTGIAAQTLIQLTVNENLRGRVLAIYSMIFRGGPALGALIMGFAAEQLGLQSALLAGGVAMLAAWLCAFLWRHRIATSFLPDGDNLTDN